MDFIIPNWPLSGNVKAFSTTRPDGVSLGEFDSLNLGAHVGDALAAVTANRSSVATKLAMPSTPLWLDQTHSNNVIDHVANADIANVDGVYTPRPNAVCAIMTADCLPLLLANLEGTEVAAVHAGWRGLADGVIENAVRKFNSEPDQILAWAGPCIGPAAFEIGQEVKTQIGGPTEAYRPSGSPDKYFADLTCLAQSRLAAIGVTQFFNSNCCTYSDPSRFFSYRRDGQTGRMATFIWIDL